MMRRRSLVRTAATTAVVAGTATAVSGRVARRQQAKAQPQYAEPAPAPQYAAPPPQYAAPPVYEEPAPAGGLSPEGIAQLKSLAELKDQGILTQAEFDAQKAEILGS